MLKVDIKLHISRYKNLRQKIIAPMNNGTPLPQF